MATIQNDSLMIELKNIEGENFNHYQKALILGIERIAGSENAGDPDHKLAVYFLSEILRATMLSDSQVNVAIGKRPYVDKK